MLMAQTGIGNDNGANKTNVEDIKSIAAKTQEDGTTMLIASLEKSTSSARKIAEEQDKKREAKKLEEKQEAKRAAEKEALKGGKKAGKAQKAEKADSRDKLSGIEKTKEGETETERIHDAEKTAVKRVEENHHSHRCRNRCNRHRLLPFYRRRSFLRRRIRR